MSKPRYPEYVRLEARRLRNSEGLSYLTIARQLHVPRTTVFRWLNPAYAESSRQSARQAKQRRTGTCEDCGAETRYNGHTVRGASRLCHACASRREGEARTIWTRDRILEAIRWWTNLYGKPPAMVDWNPTKAASTGDYQRALRAERHLGAGEIPWFTTAVKMFGSWNAAIAAAGFTPLAPHGGNGNNARRRRRFA